MTAKGGTITVASSVDRNFLPFVGPVAASMGYFAAPGRPIDYRVFYDGPETAESRALDGYRAGPVTVRLQPAPEAFRAFEGRSNMGVPTLVRLAADQAMPDVDRVIFIDVDVLVVADIGELFDMELGPHPFAAAICTSMYAWLNGQQTQGRVPRNEIDIEKHLRENIGLGPDDWYTYLNTGVSVMDLRQLREEQFGTRALEQLDERVDGLPLPDQDLLTILFKGRTAPMPPMWNVLSDILQLESSAGLPEQIRPAVDEQRAHPHIVHFAGPHKPWVRSRLLPYAGAWWHFVNQTPVARTIAERAKAKYRERRKMMDPRVRVATWLAGLRYHRGASAR